MSDIYPYRSPKLYDLWHKDDCKFGILTVRYGYWLRAVREGFNSLWRATENTDGKRRWLIYCPEPHYMIVGAIKVVDLVHIMGKHFHKAIRDHKPTLHYGIPMYQPRPSQWVSVLGVEKVVKLKNPITLERIWFSVPGFQPRDVMYLSEWMRGREKAQFKELISEMIGQIDKESE